MLTEREKWLMVKAFQAGYGRGHDDTVDGGYNGVCEHENDCAFDWLDATSADAMTVEMVLAKEAPLNYGTGKD